jgi:hypothetical protein
MQRLKTRLRDERRKPGEQGEDRFNEWTGPEGRLNKMGSFTCTKQRGRPRYKAGNNVEGESVVEGQELARGQVEEIVKKIPSRAQERLAPPASFFDDIGM